MKKNNKDFNHEHCGCGAEEHKESNTCGCGGRAKNQIKSALIRIFVSVPLLVLSYIGLGNIFSVHWLNYIDPGFFVILLLGLPIYASAFNSLKKKKITSSVLISLSITACVLLQVTIWFLAGHDANDGHGHNYIFAAAEVAFLMSLGELIENFTVGRSKRGIEKLTKLKPNIARLVTADGAETVMDISNIKVGDTVAVYPNENISVDGIVTKGNSSVNQSNLTGESLPVDKKTGDEVFASTYNEGGLLYIKVTKAAEDTNISKIVELMHSAEGKSAPISRVADKVASYLIPAAVFASVAVFILALTVFQTDIIDAVIRMVTVLVVFCPCALAIATPTAVAATIGRAGMNGVLIKSGSALEQLAHINTVAFDKTGTITSGQLTITRIIPYNGYPDFICYAAAVEKYSNHPAGIAIAGFAKSNHHHSKDCGHWSATEIKNLVGSGISGTVQGKTVLVSSPAFMEQNNIDIDIAKDDIGLARLEGMLVAACAINNKLVGLITLADKIKPDSDAVVNALNRDGYETLLLTGDNNETARTVAHQVNILQFKSNLLPQEKSQFIEAEQAQGKKVAMIGDGVNDSVCLTVADCGIAVQNLGSDLAVECSDAVLLDGNITRLPNLFKMSRLMMRTIILNITISLLISFASIILSAFGHIDPVIGALIHNTSSVFVALNSASLLLRQDRFTASLKRSYINN